MYLDFKLSKEIKKVFDKAAKTAKKCKEKRLSTELFFYELLKVYLSSEKGESETIKSAILELSVDDRLDLEKDLLMNWKNVKLDLTEEEVELGFLGESISLTKDLSTVFARSFANSALKSSYKKSKKDVDAYDLVLSCVISDGGSTKAILEKYGLSSKNLIEMDLKSAFDSGFDDEPRKTDDGFEKLFIPNDDESQGMDDAGFDDFKRQLESFISKFGGKVKAKIVNADDFMNMNGGDTSSFFGEKRISASEEDGKSMDDKFEAAGRLGGSTISTKKADPKSKTPILDQYGVNMTAESTKYDPVVGRDKEISQVIEILCCRKKNNAALIGDPGCGKTAIVEGLSKMIAEGNVPKEIKNKKIYSISVMDLQAGTMYRGDLEKRVQGLCNEIKNNSDIIIYIDEFHQAVSEGSSNISQLLKPALGRGELQAIISTTNDEYRKFIEKDGALKRRFSQIQVDEPTVEETKIILRNLSKVYGQYHQVNCPDEVIDKCVEWSGKYINDRFFPDKAIGVMDQAFSLTKLNVKAEKKETKSDKLSKKVDKLYDEILADLQSGKFEEASEKAKKKNEMVEKLEKIVEDEINKESSMWPVVTIQTVSEVISKVSGVPVDKIMNSDFSKIKKMKEELEKKVIGQDEAITELTVALQRNILGLRDPNKPIASFLLVGPTGVGKSLVSKMLASEFFGSEDNLVTIACSEYMQDWAESKLLGSAPGYVGFSDSEPRLYVLKRKPYSVILVDEIEKSSSNLYNIWLNILEQGEVTLSSGEKVSCRNAIIIFTGNVGTKSLELKGSGIGFEKLTGDAKKKSDVSVVMKEVKKEFRPEFLNRLSKIVVFNPLGEEQLKDIFDIEFGKLKDRIKDNSGFEIEVTDKIKDAVISKCEPEYGARSLQRLIVEFVEKEVCKAMLEFDITGKTKILVDMKNESDVVVDFK